MLPSSSSSSTPLPPPSTRYLLPQERPFVTFTLPQTFALISQITSTIISLPSHPERSHDYINKCTETLQQLANNNTRVDPTLIGTMISDIMVMIHSTPSTLLPTSILLPPFTQPRLEEEEEEIHELRRDFVTYRRIKRYIEGRKRDRKQGTAGKICPQCKKECGNKTSRCKTCDYLFQSHKKAMKATVVIREGRTEGEGEQKEGG